MFAILISEKGKEDRRQTFEKAEVSIGRVQGNDLVLPKGNVSKRHARLHCHDGRFVVMDLRSTNGTYVNGRKIGRATPVREDDTIYIGDFVLRVERRAESDATRFPTGTAAGAGAVDAAGPWDSEFTAKRDREAFQEEEPAPTALKPHGLVDVPTQPTPNGMRPALPTDPTQGKAAGSGATNTRSSSTTRPEFSQRSLALGVVLERVAEVVDLSSLARGSDPDPALSQRIERAVREHAKALHDDGQLPSTVELDDVIRDALRELLGLGPIELLLEDEDIHEVRVFGHERLTATRAGDSFSVDPSFSSEQALLRIISRLCRQSGQALSAGEIIVQRQLPAGMWMQAVLPPATLYGTALTLRRRRRADGDLDELVRTGAMSRAIATFLRYAVAARANILVVGPSDVTAPLIGALAAAGGPDDHLVAVQAVDVLWGIEPNPVCLRLPEGDAEAVRTLRTAGRLHPDRLVVTPVAGPTAVEVLSLIGEGAQGVLATVHAPSLRQGLERLVPDLVGARPGLRESSAGAWIASSFDLAVEFTRLRDRRPRATRIAELACADGRVTAEDVFSFTVERQGPGDALEGTFLPTGSVPRIAGEKASWANGVDLSLFKRPG